MWCFRPHLNLLACDVLVCIISCHELHHIALSCIILGSASCLVHVLGVYHVVCFFPVVLLLDSSCFVAIVRIRSTTLGRSSPVRILHGLVLLPSGISGKMNVTMDLTTIIAMLVVSILLLCRVSYPLFIKPP